MSSWLQFLFFDPDDLVLPRLNKQIGPVILVDRLVPVLIDPFRFLWLWLHQMFDVFFLLLDVVWVDLETVLLHFLGELVVKPFPKSCELSSVSGIWRHLCSSLSVHYCVESINCTWLNISHHNFITVFAILEIEYRSWLCITSTIVTPDFVGWHLW